jgi:hypothetical protein
MVADGMTVERSAGTFLIDARGCVGVIAVRRGDGAGTATAAAPVRMRLLLDNNLSPWRPDIDRGQELPGVRS